MCVWEGVLYVCVGVCLGGCVVCVCEGVLCVCVGVLMGGCVVCVCAGVCLEGGVCVSLSSAFPDDMKEHLRPILRILRI